MKKYVAWSLKQDTDGRHYSLRGQLRDGTWHTLVYGFASIELAQAVLKTMKHRAAI